MPEAEAPAKVSILFVTADPSDLARLRLSREEREIRAELQASEHRHRFEFLTAVSARSQDLSRALLQDRPQFLHFSGHGDRSGALILEDEVGARHAVQPKALADLLAAAAGDTLRCVVLNACHSAKLATALLEVAPFVVGMRRAIDDDAAIAFSIGFYQALGAGRGPAEAFELGKAQVAMRELPQRSVPLLKSRQSARPTAPIERPSAQRSPRLRLGIRSFVGHGREMEEEAERILALEPYFDGRRVRHAALWHAGILPELAAFLGEAGATRRPLHLNLAALPSIAFAAGFFLEAKGGYDIEVRQRGVAGTAEWRAGGGAPPADERLWAVEESLPGTPGSPDVALAVGINHPVLDDVRCFLGRSGITVGRILHAFFGDATAQTAIHDGAHAARLTQSLYRMIEARSFEEKGGVLHLFIAAPNALVFFLGQLARGLGRIQLYDHDFEARGVRGAYIPAFELPISS
jgi:SMODS-associated and fused to various effectors sensor domain/CHAT domain